MHWFGDILFINDDHFGYGLIIMIVLKDVFIILVMIPGFDSSEAMFHLRGLPSSLHPIADNIWTRIIHTSLVLLDTVLVEHSATDNYCVLLDKD